MRLSRIMVGLLAVLLLVATGNAVAHPLGNFSINQYSAIRIGKSEIELRYIVDMAEIPTFQEIQENSIVPRTENSNIESYLARKADLLRDGLTLEVNGQPLVLQAESKDIIFPPGAGGLPTMKIGVLYKAKLRDSKAGELRLGYRDDNFLGRAGWKEIIAVAQAGARILYSSIPQTDRSSQLNDYPTDLLNTPPQEVEARVTFTSRAVSGPMAHVEAAALPVGEGGPTDPLPQRERKNVNRQPLAKELVGNGRDRSLQTGAKRTESSTVSDLSQPIANNVVQLHANRQATPRNSFTELMATEQLGLGIILMALAVAVALGAFHALEPGHGKTLVAAYLVGTRGTMKHAFLLGLIVTAAHTAGVYIVGAVTLYASRYILPEQLYPWLGVVSGILITGLGVALFFRRYGRKGEIVSHHHGHVPDSPHGHHHSHSDAHMHHHGSSHHHENREASLKELMTLGISGGIIPCPAALVVLLGAVSMDRIGFGLILIFAFSAGLAAVLIAIGLLMVYARRFMARFRGEGELTRRWLPLTSSVFIALFGVTLTWQALQTAGLLPVQL